MNLPKKEDVNIPPKKVEEKKTKEEQVLEKKIKRSREDIERVFIEHYGVEKGSEALKKLVDRELAHGKIVSTLIGQKIHFREKAEKALQGEEKKGDDPENKELETTPDGLKDLRETERKKAVERVLSKIIEKHDDLKDPKEVYEKIQPHYHEAGDENLRGDFEKRLWKAFYDAYPDKYDEKIRADERKRLLEGDIDIDGATTAPKGEKRDKKKHKFLTKSEHPTDWYKKPKS